MLKKRSFEIHRALVCRRRRQAGLRAGKAEAPSAQERESEEVPSVSPSDPVPRKRKTPGSQYQMRSCNMKVRNRPGGAQELLPESRHCEMFTDGFKDKEFRI